ncbi:zinc ABC transporter substrate-binding protein [Acrocarpospora phusangensis]|uniref:Zinc ABC transporter substrate-binding protein n=1 Tax=Acrocarpospora phusangensis TaxID=1070424 RepID=A0A919QJC5_9ACTN|nr:metal ABC transporter substrate-binding protein [Acrocarpospora phusangensis]GIH29139.1 zinc ABC transporter substrate-binding protein [Acrocarpospora phusangensis]
MRSLTAVAGVASLTLLSAACGSSPDRSPQSAGGTLHVAAAFYPLQWLSQRVGGSDVTVEGLTKPGVEPHDLELSPRQVADIQSSGLVVYIRGVQPAVDEAVQQHAADRGFDAASVVTTIAAEPDEHGHEGEGEHEGEEAGHEHEDIGYDPHVWLDPQRFATMATKLGERLAAADPAHAAGYRERAAATAADLTALDTEFQQGLTTCANRAIVTSHAAFGYLAGRYKLEQVGITGIDPDSEPSPARLAEVARIAKEKKVTTIFTEELVSPKVAEVLANEVGAKTAVLNPLEGQPASGDYLTAMRSDLATLRTALGCT